MGCNIISIFKNDFEFEMKLVNKKKQIHLDNENVIKNNY